MNATELEDLGKNLLEWVVLPRYCHWLNLWVDSELHYSEDEKQMLHYTPERFLVTDPDRSLYGDSTLFGGAEVGSSAAFPRIVFHYSVSDGDDGGPSELTAWLEEDGEEGWRLIHLVQGFDTYLQSIYDTTSGTKQDTPYLHTPQED